MSNCYVLFIDCVALPTIIPQSSSITELVDLSADMGVAITRDNPFVQSSDINWIFNGLIITQSDKYGFSKDRKSLTVSSLNHDDGGIYKIKASNAAGYTEAEITLHVLGI